MIEPINYFFTLLDPNVESINIGHPMVFQIKSVVYQQNMLATIKMWPQGLEAAVQRLHKYYEIVLFTILPAAIIDKIIRDLVPGLADLISVVLTYEELVFEGESGYVYKDLSLLAHNRIANMDDGREPGEIIVIDSQDIAVCCDQSLVSFMQGQAYGGDLKYANIVSTAEALKHYRQSGGQQAAVAAVAEAEAEPEAVQEEKHEDGIEIGPGSD